jgi:exopolyphosphatase/guanosine-5'-triphosphate,3'-diphosphate pyrophosphatase
MKRPGQNGRVVALIDTGTNSIRLLVLCLNPNHVYMILTRRKQQALQGEGEFEEKEILMTKSMARIRPG